MKRLRIKANTELGYYELERRGILDISFYSSKTRRGRIEQNGVICPTITTSSDLIIIDWEEPDNDKKTIPDRFNSREG